MDTWIIRKHALIDCDGKCFKWQQIVNNSGKFGSPKKSLIILRFASISSSKVYCHLHCKSRTKANLWDAFYFWINPFYLSFYLQNFSFIITTVKKTFVFFSLGDFSLMTLRSCYGRMFDKSNPITRPEPEDGYCETRERQLECLPESELIESHCWCDGDECNSSSLLIHSRTTTLLLLIIVFFICFIFI